MSFGLATYDELGRLTLSLTDSSSLPVLSLDIALPAYSTWPLIPTSATFRRYGIATTQNYDDGKHFVTIHTTDPANLIGRLRMRVYLEGNFIYVMAIAAGGGVDMWLHYHTVRITVMQVAT